MVCVKFRIKQVNTLCYYYAHFTATRAQLKKKKITTTSINLLVKHFVFFPSLFPGNQIERSKKTVGPLISYYSQVIAEKKHIKKITLKRKYQSFLYFSNILLATKQRTKDNCSSNAYTHIDRWKHIGIHNIRIT